jgi:hypothetical protein
MGQKERRVSKGVYQGADRRRAKTVTKENLKSLVVYSGFYHCHEDLEWSEFRWHPEFEEFYGFVNSRLTWIKHETDRGSDIYFSPMTESENQTDIPFPDSRPCKPSQSSEP